MVTLYKTLGHNRESYFGGKENWLPEGEWMPSIEDIKLCRKGYHLMPLWTIPQWMAPTLWVAEGKDAYICDDISGKTVYSTARLVRRVEGWTETNILRARLDYLERWFPPVYLESVPAGIEMRAILNYAQEALDKPEKTDHIRHRLRFLLDRRTEIDDSLFSHYNVSEVYHLLGISNMWETYPYQETPLLLARYILLYTGLIDEWGTPQY